MKQKENLANNEELIQSASEDSTLNPSKSRFLNRLTQKLPFGVLIITIVLFSSVNAAIGYFVSSIDLNYRDISEHLFYFAVSCTILSGLFLLYLSFSVLSKRYLNGKLKTTVEQQSYFKQIKANIRNLFNPEIYFNRILKYCLVFISLILGLFIIGFIIWFLVAFIRLIINLN